MHLWPARAVATKLQPKKLFVNFFTISNLLSRFSFIGDLGILVAPFRTLTLIPNPVLTLNEFSHYRFFSFSSNGLAGKYAIGINDKNSCQLVVRLHSNFVRLSPEWLLVDEYVNRMRYDFLPNHYEILNLIGQFTYKSEGALFFKKDVTSEVDLYQGQTTLHIFNGYFTRATRRVLWIHLTPFEISPSEENP